MFAEDIQLCHQTVRKQNSLHSFEHFHTVHSCAVNHFFSFQQNAHNIMCILLECKEVIESVLCLAESRDYLVFF